MESGTIIGLLTSLVTIGVDGWLIQCHFSRARSWWGALKSGLLILGVSAGLCCADYLVMTTFNLIDSSHGVMSTGIPILVATIASLVSLAAFALGAACLSERRLG